MGFETAVETTSAAPTQRVIVILGAGRSGTSAITRGLQALGVELGDQLRPAGGKNPTGFFEDESLMKVNKRLRKALGLRAESVSLIEPHHGRHPPCRPFSRRPERPSAVDLAHIPFGAISMLVPFAYCRSGVWCSIP